MFWRKVLDIYATSGDYVAKNDLSKQFFATLQNKMHWAMRKAASTQVTVLLTGETGVDNERFARARCTA